MLSDLIPSNDLSDKEKSLYDIFNQDDLDMYAIDAIQWMIAELKGTNSIWSSWCPNTHRILQELIDKKSLLPQFPLHDNKARDNSHPSKDCHALYSNIIKENIGQNLI
jgi:hypothetical protein